MLLLLWLKSWDLNTEQRTDEIGMGRDGTERDETRRDGTERKGICDPPQASNLSSLVFQRHDIVESHARFKRLHFRSIVSYTTIFTFV